jgi:hypothetical protein
MIALVLIAFATALVASAIWLLRRKRARRIGVWINGERFVRH